MRRQPPSPGRTLSILSHTTRELHSQPASRQDAQVHVIVREGSRLIVGEANPALTLTYAGKAGGKAYLSLDEGATVWIEHWHNPESSATLCIEIGPHAHVGLSEEATTAAPSHGFEIVLKSGGTSSLAAIWRIDQSPLRIIGTSARCLLNLALRSPAGQLIEVALHENATDALMENFSKLALSRLLPEVESTHIKWINVDAPSEPLPVGVDSKYQETLQELLSDSKVPASGSKIKRQGNIAGTVREYVRARTPPLHWERFAPVVFAPDALGPGVPRRRIALGPGQQLLVNGKVVAAHELINGLSIRQHTDDHYICYITPSALTEEETVLAGLSLLANTDRLSPSHNAEQCRQQMLAHTAARNEMRLSSNPALRLELGGHSIDKHPSSSEPGIWRFVVPETMPPDALHIVCRSAVARDTATIALTDDRILGVAISDLVVHGPAGSRHVDLSHPSWSGLHPWEYRRGRAMRWTNGLATLPYAAHGLQGGETIELHVASVGRYWVDASIDEQEQAA